MWAHQEYCHLCCIQGRLYLLAPLASSFNTSVILDCDGVITSKGLEHCLEALQPSGIPMAIADEDLGTLRDSHRLPPHLSCAELRLTCRGVLFGSGFWQTSGIGSNEGYESPSSETLATC